MENTMLNKYRGDHWKQGIESLSYYLTPALLQFCISEVTPLLALHFPTAPRSQLPFWAMSKGLTGR